MLEQTILTLPPKTVFDAAMMVFVATISAAEVEYESEYSTELRRRLLQAWDDADAGAMAWDILMMVDDIVDALEEPEVRLLQ